MRQMQAWVVCATVLTFYGFLSACGHSSNPNVLSDTKSCIITPELKKLIILTNPELTTVHNEIELTGSVSYNQDHLYRYQSLVSGIVRAVHFNIGDYVNQGDVLAEIQTTELSSQKADLRKAELELSLAQRQLVATKSLHIDGVASDKDLLEANSRVESLFAEVNRIKESVKIQGGNIDKNIVVIRAPFSGYVVEKKITDGYQVNSGEDNLFVLSDLKKVWVLLNVYPEQLNMVKAGQQVTIQSTAYKDRTFIGNIQKVLNVFDPEERVLKAIVEIDNQDLSLKPAMMVSVAVEQKSTQTAIAIPTGATIFDNNVYHVLVYKDKCDVEAMTIEPIAKNKRYVYVLPETLRTSDSIITQNQLLIYNKLKER
ncbi:MAG: efflux RND transporter periplasmic adaptor subunit [Bacteroidetes bacterium]|nr:efflux RND transporter periplasmic adaptor subunit [Bacteroidota bacterium]MBS1739490.1 efflux RND transporter periplasmic adaptor subunit [Bacteroidota bacterium]